MSPPRIVCAGEIMWDFHAEPGATLTRAARFARRPGGAAANVAIELTSLGVAAAAAGVISRDAFGQGLRHALEEHGIDTSALIERRGRDGLVFIEQLERTERFLTYRPAFERYPARLLLPTRWRKQPPVGARVHIANLDPDRASLGALSALAERAAAGGCRMSVDLNARPRPWRARQSLPRAAHRLLAAADWVKASVDDLRSVGIATGAGDITAARRALSIERGTLILTQGCRLLRAAGPWGSARVASLADVAGSSVGAGDAFCAKLLAELAGSAATAPTRAFWRRALRAASAHAGSWLAQRHQERQ